MLFNKININSEFYLKNPYLRYLNIIRTHQKSESKTVLVLSICEIVKSDNYGKY